MTARPSVSFRPTLSVPALGAVLNRLLVSAYKLLGLLVLSTILVGISSFVGIRLFYLIHHAWIVPEVVSPTDPAVLDLQSRIAQEGWMRHKLLGERVGLEARLRRTQLISQLEQDFQVGFPSAVGRDASSGRASLEMLEALSQQQQGLSSELARYEREIGQKSLDRLKQDHLARLIDDEQFLRESYQLTQLTQAKLSLQEKGVELADRIRRLSRDVAASEAARAVSQRPKAEAALSYETLLMRREHDRSVAEATSALDEAEVLANSLRDMDTAVAEYDKLLATLRSAPPLRAREERLNLAFVPYDNEGAVREGSAVFACRLWVLVCREVGTVKTYLGGEHEKQHPVFGQSLRGQFVELSLLDPEAVKRSVLHVNRRPLGL